MFKFLLSITTLFFMGCSLAPLNDAEKKQIDQVGAAIILDDVLKLSYVGTTVFDNENAALNVSSWNLNSVIAQEFSTELKSVGKTYKSLSFDKQKIKAAIK